MCVSRFAYLIIFEGFRPEWYISTLYHCRDISFWSETLDAYHCCCTAPLGSHTSWLGVKDQWLISYWFTSQRATMDSPSTDTNRSPSKHRGHVCFSECSLHVYLCFNISEYLSLSVLSSPRATCRQSWQRSVPVSARIWRMCDRSSPRVTLPAAAWLTMPSSDNSCCR